MKKCKKCLSLFDSRQCPACAKACGAAWRKANKDRISAYNAEYKVLNPEKTKECNDRYYAKNKGKAYEYSVFWRKANPEKALATRTAYLSINKEKVVSYQREYARSNKSKRSYLEGLRRAAKVSATPSWSDDFLVSEAYDLAALRTKVTGIEWHVDHIVPLRSRFVCGLHCAANLRVITAKENQVKSNATWPDMP